MEKRFYANSTSMYAEWRKLLQTCNTYIRSFSLTTMVMNAVDDGDDDEESYEVSILIDQ